jgi:uncharacterized protein YcbK (DUF882 family)
MSRLIGDAMHRGGALPARWVLAPGLGAEEQGEAVLRRRPYSAFNPVMDRRRFVTLAGALLAVPRPLWAAPAVAPLRRLRLVNTNTGETFDGSFRDELGPIATALADLSDFLRDYHSGEKTAIDVRVLDFLASVIDAVGETRATVLSAYRTRETNAKLARTQFGVAENSQHIYGRALDIRLENRNERAVQAARAMRYGGVGWYPRSGFLHIDCGPVRNWTLDERRLDLLLLDARRELFSPGDRNHIVLPGGEQTGNQLPELGNSGDMLPSLEHSSQPLRDFDLSKHLFSRRQIGRSSGSISTRGVRF